MTVFIELRRVLHHYQWVRICVGSQLLDVWNEPEFAIIQTERREINIFIVQATCKSQVQHVRYPSHMSI